MQERLRAEPSVRTLDPLHDLLREKHEHDLALALWLAGVFFDFTPFASEYYQRTHAPFIGTDSKPGPERSKSPDKNVVQARSRCHSRADQQGVRG